MLRVGHCSADHHCHCAGRGQAVDADQQKHHRQLRLRALRPAAVLLLCSAPVGLFFLPSNFRQLFCCKWRCSAQHGACLLGRAVRRAALAFSGGTLPCHSSSSRPGCTRTYDVESFCRMHQWSFRTFRHVSYHSWSLPVRIRCFQSLVHRKCTRMSLSVFCVSDTQR